MIIWAACKNRFYLDQEDAMLFNMDYLVAKSKSRAADTWLPRIPFCPPRVLVRTSQNLTPSMPPIGITAERNGQRENKWTKNCCTIICYHFFSIVAAPKLATTSTTHDHQSYHLEAECSMFSSCLAFCPYHRSCFLYSAEGIGIGTGMEYRIE